MNMIKGKTRSGFEFSVNEEIAEDWRVAKALAATQSKKNEEQISGAVKLVQMILGDQEEDLMQSVMDESGIVKVQDIFDNVSDILTAISESGEKGKN